MTHPVPCCFLRRAIVLVLAVFGVAMSRAQAHGISDASRETMTEGGVLQYIWLGAEHMLTGYDHLLFLFGVVFFLTGFRDVVRFITAFTVGHCITLLGATLAGVTANAYLIDAVIALSVIYKGFENLDGFQKIFETRAPDLLTMVFVFGLIHGFGLSTRLQELPLGEDGLVFRILAFNVGVELGQVAALTVMLAFFAAWRSSKRFERFDAMSNKALVLAGVGLFFYQMIGYATDDHHGSAADVHDHAERGHDHGAHDHGAHDHGAHDHGAHDHGAHDRGEQVHDHGAQGHDHGAAHAEPAGEPHAREVEEPAEAPAPATEPHPHDTPAAPEPERDGHHHHGGAHHEHDDGHRH